MRRLEMRVQSAPDKQTNEQGTDAGVAMIHHPGKMLAELIEMGVNPIVVLCGRPISPRTETGNAGDDVSPWWGVIGVLSMVAFVLALVWGIRA